MKKIAWVDPDTGILQITVPAYGGDFQRHTGLSDDDFLASRVLKDVPVGVTPHIIEDDNPEIKAFLDDGTFRKAWDYVGNALTVDMPTARGVHMARIRNARNIQLAAKDITFMRAMEAGDTSAQVTIATEKQVLRDIPQTFDITTGVTTPELLTARWPSELPARE